MNNFDKAFVLGFYNSFLRTKLNCHKRKYISFKYMQFSKKDVVYMCSDLVIDFKDRYVLKTL